jgi:hypothetical protein
MAMQYKPSHLPCIANQDNAMYICIQCIAHALQTKPSARHSDDKPDTTSKAKERCNQYMRLIRATCPSRPKLGMG